MLTQIRFNPFLSFKASDLLLRLQTYKRSLQYVDLSAVNVFLDPATKNLYFYSGHPNAEVITLSEALAVTFTTAKEDTFTITEQLAQSFSRPVTDSMSMIESAALLVSLPTSDALSMSDASPVLATGLGKQDSVVVSEVLAKSLTSEKSDTVSFAELPVLAASLC